MIQANAFVCTACSRIYPLDTLEWRCSCGGLFALQTWPPFEAVRIDEKQPGLWRYGELLPLDAAWELMTLGEGSTPLLPIDWDGQTIHLKLESLSATGSFKDRGAAVLVTALRGLGIQRVVEDSSGNAGVSLAAYAARAGIGCEIYVPSTAAGPKLVQMAAYGATVTKIEGIREDAAQAAWAAAARGSHYASHVYSPFFLAGIETMAYELWEQLGHRAPAALVLPVGNGTLLLGVYRGFRRLHRAGLISRQPRLFAVQAAACAPVHRAWLEGQEKVAAVVAGPTAASGIAVGQPARGTQILAALRATNGTVVTVTEDEIEQARNQLARTGFYVEETAATSVAAVVALRGQLSALAAEPIVVPLTGYGLKTWRTP